MTHYLCCDLKDDPELIAKYEEYHAPGNAWPEIMTSIKNAGITDMRIYRAGNRLFMVMETDETFDPAAKAAADAADPKVQEWETLMDTFQQRMPFAEEGVKWVEMKQIFALG